MKKLIALILAMVMVLSLSSAVMAEEAAEYTGEEVTISFSSTFQETETGGKIVSWFKDYLENATGGKIKVNISFGGQLFNDFDQLDGVANGAVNMIALGHNPVAATVPLLCSIPDFAPESVENALHYFDYLLFDNEETAALLQGEAEALGVKYLNVISNGANAFLATFEFSDLQSLVDGSKAFGNMEPAKYEALGFTVEQVSPFDYTQAFQTGQIDASQMSSTPMISMGLQNEAKYWMYDNTYAAGNFFTVNLDWWNSLSPEAQAAIQDAAKATENYSIELYTEAIKDEQQGLIDQGVTLVKINDDDFDRWWSVIMESKKADSMAKAADPDATLTILNAAAEFTGYKFAE